MKEDEKEDETSVGFLYCNLMDMGSTCNRNLRRVPTSVRCLGIVFWVKSVVRCIEPRSEFCDNAFQWEFAHSLS